MNSKQMQYVIALSRTCNFSQASEKMNISQPALSKQISNLEQELGVRLFERDTVHVTLTPAGEHFVREAETLLLREDQLLRAMEQYKSGEKGRVIIGISPFRNLYLMPDLIYRFREKYPGVQVVLQEANSDQLRRDAAEGKFDFAIVNLPVDESVLDVILLEQEELVLAVPNNLLSRIPGDPEEFRSGIDFSKCRDLPFAMVAQTQEMRRYFDYLCAGCGITPEIAVEVAGGVSSAWSMAQSGIGATLLPLRFVGEQPFDENLTLFPLRNTTYTRQPAIVTRRGQYLSPYARYLIRLLTEK